MYVYFTTLIRLLSLWSFWIFNLMWYPAQVSILTWPDVDVVWNLHSGLMTNPLQCNLIRLIGKLKVSFPKCVAHFIDWWVTNAPQMVMSLWLNRNIWHCTNQGNVMLAALSVILNYGACRKLVGTVHSWKLRFGENSQHRFGETSWAKSLHASNVALKKMITTNLWMELWIIWIAWSHYTAIFYPLWKVPVAQLKHAACIKFVVQISWQICGAFFNDPSPGTVNHNQ